MNAPTWDLTRFFPSFGSDAYQRFLSDLKRDLQENLAHVPAPLSRDTIDDWGAFLERIESLATRLSHIGSYVGCLASADGDNEAYQRAEAQLSTLSAEFEKLDTAMKLALGQAGEEIFTRLVESPKARGAEHPLRHARKDARFRMSRELESLSAELSPDGLYGWARLYDVVSSKLAFEVTDGSGAKTKVPMAQRRARMNDPHRRVREEAFHSGNLAWESVADTVAAALNHIAGTRLVLQKKRNIGHVHDIALHDAAISKKTLDAMMEAVASGAEVARRGLRAKARALGLSKLSWFDLGAPFPSGEDATFSWSDATSMISGVLRKSYPAFDQYFSHALASQWVEAEPRKGKRPGAYCTRSDYTGEQRVYMTFLGSFEDVSTLAHEMGHAFHSHLLRDARPLARHYPMTLAETASTFAENLLADGLRSQGGNSELRLLGETANDAAAFLLDIPTRFHFETAYYAKREAGELSPTELCTLMRETARTVFQDTLADKGEDSWFWASKLHFYIPDVCFYNFPYTFGYLLSRAIYADFRERGAPFIPRYEEFLKRSGSGDAHEVVKATLGYDVETAEFWGRAIRTLEEPVTRLEALVKSP